MTFDECTVNATQTTYRPEAQSLESDTVVIIIIIFIIVTSREHMVDCLIAFPRVGIMVLSLPRTDSSHVNEPMPM
jgi:hypothetical protein